MSTIDLDYKHLLGVFSKNFVKGGLMIGIAITIIEFIYKSKDLIGLYAFCTGSFVVAQILLYEHMAFKNPMQIETFLTNSIAGGIAWVFYMLLLSYLYYSGFPPQQCVYICISAYVIMCVLYYYFM